MKKRHNSLKMCRTTIAWLNDPMLSGIKGGDPLLYFSKLNAYCGGIRDTATVPTLAATGICDGCTGQQPDTDNGAAGMRGKYIP